MPCRVHNDWTLKLFIYDTIVSMDYFIGFLIGYYIRDFFRYLRKLADYKIIEDFESEWIVEDEPQ